MRLYLFTGAGNNFVVLDGRGADMAAFRLPERIAALCGKFGTDGLMMLDTDPELDFAMEFYNPDGSGGMMCGNGGRCIAAFADYLGIPSQGNVYHFRAPDGPHVAVLLARPSLTDGKGECPTGALNNCWMVRLQMKDVQGVTPVLGGYFLDTGTRHFVKFVPQVGSMDMDSVAKPLRWAPEFAPVGANVNLVEVAPDGLHVRTYEKGVEGETLACGTGLTASALAACFAGIPGLGAAVSPAGSSVPDAGGAVSPAGSSVPDACAAVSPAGSSVPDACAAVSPAGSFVPDAGGAVSSAGPSGQVTYCLQCRRGDWLQVDFHQNGPASFSEVFLTGPAELLRGVEVPLDE